MFWVLSWKTQYPVVLFQGSKWGARVSRHRHAQLISVSEQINETRWRGIRAPRFSARRLGRVPRLIIGSAQVFTALALTTDHWPLTSPLSDRRHNEMVSDECKVTLPPVNAESCETEELTYTDRLNVVWNNSFRRIFGCCWRESVASLQIYCHTLPMAYMIDQRKILFWKTVLTSGIQVVRTLAILK